MRTNCLSVILVVSLLVLIGGCSHDQVAAPEASDSQTGTDGQITNSGDVVTLEDLQAGMGGGVKLAGPDVAITAFTASPTNLLPGDTLALQATVANLGAAPAQGPFEVWIGVLNTGFEFARVSIDQLAPWESRSGVVNFTLPAAKLAAAYPPGTYTLYCTHDFADPVPTNDYLLHDVELSVPTGLPFPDTPDQLVENFKTTYETMDVAGYGALLDPDYLMILEASTFMQFPEVGETLDFSEETRIAEHMFGGAVGHDAEGNPVNPVSAIDFQTLTQLTAWQTSPPDDPVPNSISALFSVLIEFNRPGDKTLQVSGMARFYVTSHDSLYGGQVRPYYQMIGQWDLTDTGKPVEDLCWGSVKALYR